MLTVKYKGNGTFALFDAEKPTRYSVLFAAKNIRLLSGVLNIGTFDTFDKCIEEVKFLCKKSGLTQAIFLRAVAKTLTGEYNIRHVRLGVHEICCNMAIKQNPIYKGSFYDCLRLLENWVRNEAMILGFASLAFDAYKLDIGASEFARIPSIEKEDKRGYRTYDEAIAVLGEIQSYLKKPLSQVFLMGVKSWSNLANWWACKVDELRIFVRAENYPTTISQFIKNENVFLGKGKKCACQAHLDSIVSKIGYCNVGEVIDRYESQAKSSKGECKYTALVEIYKDYLLRSIEAISSIIIDGDNLGSFKNAIINLHTDLILFGGLVGEQAQAAFMSNSAEK